MTPTPPNPSEAAILKTLLYADIFDYPLSEAEIHHYLIGHALPLPQVQATLQNSPWLGQHLIRANGYYTLKAEAAEIRHQREAVAQKLVGPALFYGHLLSLFPFVRMVALTGALAVRNPSSPGDDFDYLLITRAGRVWTARLLILVLVRAARLWGVKLCPNYILAEGNLAQARQNLYVARELAQMIPISGRGLYEAMLAANPWAGDYLPNARGQLYPAHERPGGWLWRMGGALQKIGERLLGGRLGEALEAWEQSRKTAKFAQEAAQHPHSAAIVDGEQVKGHFNDYGHYIMSQYAAKLAQYELSE
jgi:hypothetical protein